MNGCVVVVVVSKRDSEMAYTSMGVNLKPIEVTRDGLSAVVLEAICSPRSIDLTNTSRLI
ncbi:MAG: hypothetical protein GY775_16040 [Candidatus Scalindua sp.]|nr:hypothetical protein [Candidatus Scalindua sp.]